MLRLLLQQLRRDRLTLPIWIVGTVLLLAASANSVLAEYGDAEGRAKILQVALATPALLALRGIPHGASVGSAVHFQSFAFLAVTIGLMNTFLATRHGRADEEKGRRELVLAAPVSRLSPPLATLVLGVLGNAVFVALAVAGYRTAGLDLAGAVLSATALGVTGLAFLGLGLVAGELAPTSRAANGVGAVVVLTAYALRAAGDALGTPDLAAQTLTPAWPSWLSPIGWGQQTLAFTENRWWPVLWIGALAAVAVTIALMLHARRELGASLLPERTGRAIGGPLMGSPIGLAWRLQAPTLVAWAAGSALLGLALGSLVTAIANADIDNPGVQQVLQSLGHTQGDLARALIPALMVLVGVLAAAAGVQAVLRLREEETAGRTEEVLAAPRSRLGWLLAFTAVGGLSVLVVLLATGLTSALGFVLIGNAHDAWLALGQALVQGPAALTFVAAAAVFVGLVPRAAVALGWGVFAAGVGVGLFGDLLGIPDAVIDLSPINNVPGLPTDEWLPTVVLGAVALGLAGLAALAFRRRDLVT